MAIKEHHVVAQNTGTDAIGLAEGERDRLVAYDIEDDLANGTVIALQHSPLGASTYTTVKTFVDGATDLVGAARLTQGWELRLWCTTFGAGDTPLLKIG